MLLNAIFGTISLAYTLGSIPFGLLLARAAGIDIRKVGSGNIGATNVLRTGNKGLAILTLLLDAGKGFVAVWLTRYIYGTDFTTIAGLFVVIGHIFSVWLSFRGGKGVATALGVFFGLNWIFALTICGMWLLVFIVTRYSSLASLLSMGYSCIAAYLLDNNMTAMLALSVAALVMFTHRDNIIRLLQGTEMSFRKPA